MLKLRAKESLETDGALKEISRLNQCAAKVSMTIERLSKCSQGHSPRTLRPLMRHEEQKSLRAIPMVKKQGCSFNEAQGPTAVPNRMSLDAIDIWPHLPCHAFSACPAACTSCRLRLVSSCHIPTRGWDIRGNLKPWLLQFCSTGSHICANLAGWASSGRCAVAGMTFPKNLGRLEP